MSERLLVNVVVVVYILLFYSEASTFKLHFTIKSDSKQNRTKYRNGLFLFVCRQSRAKAEPLKIDFNS